MYTQIIQELENFDTNPIGTEAVENIRRVYLTCHYFASMFDNPNDLKKAYKAISNMTNYANHHAVTIQIVAAMGLRNLDREWEGLKIIGYQFPQIIIGNLDKFIICLQYLLHGNTKVEESLPECAKQAAYETALKIYVKKLESLFNIDRNKSTR
ncbi:hypothetical protein NIES2107_57050 [Nostoc carneum NIES-2107]|nr:hypothetical protein NIES2107_57050 [Nostoc carneum NIES-2107]